MSQATAAKIDAGLGDSVQTISDAQAKEYSYIICVDKSGSMGEPSLKMKGRTRWDEAQELTESLARFAEQHDENNNITVVTFGGSVKVYEDVKADKVHEVFTSCQPGGSTNLAGALDAAFAKKFKSKRPAIIIVATDGIPDSEEDVQASIVGATQKIEKGEDIGIQFVQIGDDKHATAFLGDLDDNLDGAKFDIVNALTREETEKLTVGQMLYLAIND